MFDGWWLRTSHSHGLLAVIVAVTIAPASSAGTSPAVATVVQTQLAALAAPKVAGAVVSVTPARIADSRNNQQIPGPVAASGTASVQVTGQGGVPAGNVAAVVLTVTAVSPQSSGYITVWPSGIARTNNSNLNFQARQKISNTVTVPVGPDGKIQLFNGSGGTVRLVVDVTGYTLAGSTDVDRVGELVFKRTNYLARDLSHEQLPYITNGAGPLDGTGTYDDQGVSVHIINGVAYDHPVLQAQFVLSRLSSYEHNKDPRYLGRIRAHGDRLIANAVVSRGAMYLPYPFNFALHGDASDMMTAPWYSGMAQGQALSAFVRLFEVTGDQKYKKAADGIFASFTNVKKDGVPWTVEVDSQGYLWFEEYAKDGGPDWTLNGHIFAIYGLYDYYRLTASAPALKLFQGGITSVEGRLGKYRNPGWISRYCQKHLGVFSTSYHSVHVGQLYELYNMTGAPSLARSADLFLNDYPSSQRGGSGYLAEGAHEAYQVLNGVVTSTRAVQLSAAQTVTIGSRQGIAGTDGVWLRVDTGTIAGYWVREAADRAFVKGAIQTYLFGPVRLGVFEQGTYSGYKFNASGLRSTTKTFTLNRNSAAHVDELTVINGVLYYRVADGVWAGYRIPSQPGLTLA